MYNAGTQITSGNLGFANTNTQKIKRVFYPLTDMDIKKPHIFFRDDFKKSKLVCLTYKGMIDFINDEKLVDYYQYYVVVPLREFTVLVNMGKNEKYNGVYVNIPYDFPLKPSDIRSLKLEEKEENDPTEIDTVNNDHEEEDKKIREGIVKPELVGTLDENKLPPIEDTPFTLANECFTIMNW